MAAPDILDKEDELKNDSPSLLDMLQISQIRDRLSLEIETIHEDIKKIEKMRRESIGQIEEKKRKLRAQIDPKRIAEEHDKAVHQLQETQVEIIKRKKSIAMLDETIEKLEKNLAYVQDDHDKLVAELEKKKRKLLEQYEKYNTIQMKIDELVKMLKNEEKDFREKLNSVEERKSDLKNLMNLSDEELKEELTKLEEENIQITSQHEVMKKELEQKLSILASDPDVQNVLSLIESGELGNMSDEQNANIELFKQYQSQSDDILDHLSRIQIEHESDYMEDLTDDEEYLKLFKTRPSITTAEKYLLQTVHEEEFEDDKNLSQYIEDGHISKTIQEDKLSEKFKDVLETYDRDKELFGKDSDLHFWGSQGTPGESLISEGTSDEDEKYKKFQKGLFHDSIGSHISSSRASSQTIVSSIDVEYLKRTYGKALSLGLAEIVQVQPSDPIHYLAHWLFKYRYNQEVDEIKKHEIQQLMMEREKLAAEAWHKALTKEAVYVLNDVINEAQDIALRKELQRIAKEMIDAEEET